MRPRVYSVSCAFLQGDHLTNPASATLLTISFVMCSPIPQTHKTRFRDVAVWGLAGLLLLRRFFTSIRRCCENDDVAFLERVGLLLVALLTRSVQRSCFRPGTRGSAPCDLFFTTFFGTLPPRMDGALVLELIGLLLVAFPRRSDTDMLPSACLSWKTVTEAHTSKRNNLWSAP